MLSEQKVALGCIQGVFAGVAPRQSEENFTNAHHLVGMLQQIAQSTIPRVKANRWLGYVQGILVMKGMLDVQTERDATRSIFNGE